MALDRTWFNALVDDDGTNTVGTVWNKAQIDALLDSVDAEFTATIAPPSNFGAVLPSTGGGTPLYVVNIGVQQRLGKVLYIGGRIVLSSKGALGAGSLAVNVPALSNPSEHQGGIAIGFFGGLATPVARLATYIAPGAAAFVITKVPAAGSTVISELQVADITNGFDFIFGGCYLTT